MSAAPSPSRATWNSAFTIPISATTRETRSSSARPEISIRQATSTPFSAACWPASSTKCGEPWVLRGKSNCSNSALAAACSRKMFLTGRKRSFRISSAPCAISSSKARPPCASELKKLLGRHLDSGKAELGAPDALSEAPTHDIPTIVFANEFFDALPVEILGTKGSLRIDAREGRFTETWAQPSPEELEFLDRYSVHPEPDERIEAPLAAQRFMEQMAANIQHGFLVAIDYGYTREEQLAGRHRGTLKALRHHSISANPYEAPGEQDITADVNFTALAAAANKHGMQTQKLDHSMPIPDGHRRSQSICRRLRRMPPAAGARQSSAAAKASSDARRHGRKLSSPDRQ